MRTRQGLPRSGRRSPWRAAQAAVAFVLVLFSGCGPEGPPDGTGAAEPAAREPAAEAPEPAELSAPVERVWPAGELRPGGVVASDLDREETHVYRLPLEAGQYLRLQVEQYGVDVELVLSSPEGEVLLRADRPINDRGPELVLALAGASGEHRLTVRAYPKYGPGRYEARLEALRPASARDRLAATTYRRFREAEGLPREEAIRAWEETLATWRELDETVLEGEVLARIGIDHYYHGEWEHSAERTREACRAMARAGDRHWEAVLRNGFGAMAASVGQVEEALEQYRRALALARQAHDPRTEATALTGIGATYRRQGHIQQALGHFEAALAILPESDRATRPYALHDLGVFYFRYFDDPDRARELLVAARDTWRDNPDHRRWKARTLSYLAWIAWETGRLAEARSGVEEALAVRDGFDPCGRATQLGRLAMVEEEDGDREAADARLADAFAILRETECPRNEATILWLAGLLAERRRDASTALTHYERSRSLAATQGDRTRVADALSGIARARRALGQRGEALSASRQVVAIFEDVRPSVWREDLRRAYFATAQDHFDLHVGLLVEQGHAAEAWAAAERARAQVLRDLLLESGIRLRRTADAALVERERELRRELDALEAERLKVSEADSSTLPDLQREIRSGIEGLERVRGEIRRQSPGYAALTAPEPLSLPEVQRDLLDPGTLLLEYRLGEEASWLWAITPESFEGFTLPPREEIEAVAREAARWTRSLRWPGRNPAPLCELSRIVLGPVAGELDGRRLVVVVADGALEEVSFAALPSPGAADCAEAAPLVAGHEVVYLPSVAALAVQRRLLADRRPAPGWLAMVTDPVYGPEDERLSRAGAPRPASLERALPGRFERLRHSGEEAAAVLVELPRSKTVVVTGLDASEETVTGGTLAGHRIVHFATHGVLNPEQPLLSYLALSQVSADGRPVDGDLYAHEIYDLELPAELVVLSACDTARGRQVRGEGLVSGLPRAFLYAGAARVLVSLWPVPDRSTRDLMVLFYRGLIGQGLPPGRALQEAQRALWRDGRPPYQWAGFVLQGDWRPLPPF